MDFQFHYGTIKSGDVVDALYLHFAFNSTMVRLKVSKPVYYVLAYVLSIPLWYD